MSGTVSGGKKALRTRAQKYIDQGYTETEARKMVSDDYRRIGRIGGKKGTTGGVANDSKRAAELGAIGGKYSRRGYKLIERHDTYGIYQRLSDGATVEFKY